MKKDEVKREGGMILPPSTPLASAFSLFSAASEHLAELSVPALSFHIPLSSLPWFQSGADKRRAGRQTQSSRTHRPDVRLFVLAGAGHGNSL